MMSKWGKAKNLAAQGEQAAEHLAVLKQQFSSIKISEPIEKALLRVLGNAFFLSRWLRRFPEGFSQVLSEANWTEPKTLKTYQAQKNYQDLLKLKTPEEATDALLYFKYQELFRITLKDLGLQYPFEEIALEISELARAILQAMLQLCLKSSGIDQQKAQSYFSVLSMGKLGGLELNFSSDVDLIYFCDASLMESSYGGELIKLAQKYTQALSAKKAGGFLYRVDLELRPHGPRGNLVPSLDSLENYYESLGQNWERMALIRANWAAGSKPLIKKFIKEVQPFVYRRRSDFTFLQDLNKMREKIRQSLQNSSNQNYHIKLGPGGIRQLEFFVQSFQVLYGGINSSLQTPSLIQALEELGKLQILPKAEVSKLKEAYVYLRTVENRIQQMEERQTHQLPTDPLQETALLRGLGYEGNLDQAKEDFFKQLTKHRKLVEEHFNNLIK